MVRSISNAGDKIKVFVLPPPPLKLNGEEWAIVGGENI